MSGVVGPRLSTVFQNQYSFQFDGTNEYITIPNDTSLNFTSAFSYSVWFKTTDTTSTMTLTSNQSKFFVQLYSPTTRIRCQLFDGSASVVNTDINSSGYNDGNWHHIAFTTDGLTTANGIKVYYDGVLTAQGTLNNNGINTSAFPYQIGRHTSTWYYEGLIDEVSIFNSELSASDITNLYNSGTSTSLSSYPSLVSWWRMGDGDTWNGSIWTLTDQGSGGNNATSANMEEADRVIDTP